MTTATETTTETTTGAPILYDVPCWDDRTNVGYNSHNFCPYADTRPYLCCTNCGAREYDDGTIHHADAPIDTALLARLGEKARKDVQKARRARNAADKTGDWPGRMLPAAVALKLAEQNYARYAGY